MIGAELVPALSAMAAVQVLLNNLLYDVSQTALATDGSTPPPTPAAIS